MSTLKCFHLVSEAACCPRSHWAMGHGAQGPQGTPWPLGPWTPGARLIIKLQVLRGTPRMDNTIWAPRYGTLRLRCHLLEDMYIITPARDPNQGPRDPRGPPGPLGRDTLGTPNHPQGHTCPATKRPLLLQAVQHTSLFRMLSILSSTNRNPQNPGTPNHPRDTRETPGLED